jgi:predicted dehydrogenase
MLNSQVGVGIVGAGIMGTAHADAFMADRRARVVAVASVPAGGAQMLARRCGAPSITDDYRQVIENPDVDLVVVATPDHLHATIAVDVAAAGKAVFVEKPLSTSLGDAAAIIEAVTINKVFGMTAFSHRWLPPYANAHDEISRGSIGDPRLAYARKNDRISVPTEMLSWAGATSPAWFLSSHDIDIVCWLMGLEAVEVFASEVRGVLSNRGIDTADAIQAQVRFSEGAVATFESCWVYPNTFPAVTDSFIEVVGTTGVVHIDRTRNGVDLATHADHTYPGSAIVSNINGHVQGALRSMAEHVIDCIVDGAQPLVTLKSSYHVSAILTAVHESIATGGVVAVPRDDSNEGGIRSHV